MRSMRWYPPEERSDCVQSRIRVLWAGCVQVKAVHMLSIVPGIVHRKDALFFAVKTLEIQRFLKMKNLWISRSYCWNIWIFYRDFR